MTNRNLKIGYVILSAALLCVSCEKKINWDLKASDEQFLIVDGIITNELKQQSIHLSLSLTSPDDSISYPENVELSVFDGADTIHFIQDPINKGDYSSETKFAGVINKTYALEINYKNTSFKAEADMYPVSTDIDLTYIPNSDSTMYYIPNEIAQFNPDEAAMYEVSLDWSAVPGFEELPETETKARLYYYVLSTIDVNQIFAPEHETVFFPAGTNLQLKKYALSPEHESFIRSVLLETQWHGSNFDTEEGNVHTNLSNGALGFFGACSVISYSTVVE